MQTTGTPSAGPGAGDAVSKPFSRPSDEVPYGGGGAVRAEMGGRRGRSAEAGATTLPRAKGGLSTKRGLWPEDRAPADQMQSQSVLREEFV